MASAWELWQQNEDLSAGGQNDVVQSTGLSSSAHADSDDVFDQLDRNNDAAQVHLAHEQHQGATAVSEDAGATTNQDVDQAVSTSPHTARRPETHLPADDGAQEASTAQAPAGTGLHTLFAAEEGTGIAGSAISAQDPAAAQQLLSDDAQPSLLDTGNDDMAAAEMRHDGSDTALLEQHGGTAGDSSVVSQGRAGQLGSGSVYVADSTQQSDKQTLGERDAGMQHTASDDLFAQFDRTADAAPHAYEGCRGDVDTAADTVMALKGGSDAHNPGADGGVVPADAHDDDMASAVLTLHSQSLQERTATLQQPRQATADTQHSLHEQHIARHAQHSDAGGTASDAAQQEWPVSSTAGASSEPAQHDYIAAGTHFATAPEPPIEAVLDTMQLPDVPACSPVPARSPADALHQEQESAAEALQQHIQPDGVLHDSSPPAVSTAHSTVEQQAERTSQASAGPPVPEGDQHTEQPLSERAFVSLSGPPSGFAAMLTQSQAEAAQQRRCESSDATPMSRSGHHHTHELDVGDAQSCMQQPAWHAQGSAVATTTHVADEAAAFADPSQALAAALHSAHEAVAHSADADSAAACRVRASAPQPPDAPMAAFKAPPAPRSDRSGTLHSEPSSPSKQQAASPRAASASDAHSSGAVKRRGGILGLLTRRRDNADSGNSAAAQAAAPPLEDRPIDAAVLQAAEQLAHEQPTGGQDTPSASVGGGDAAQAAQRIASELLRIHALRTQQAAAHEAAQRDAETLRSEVQAARREVAAARDAGGAARRERDTAIENLASLHQMFIRALQDVVVLRSHAQSSRCVPRNARTDLGPRSCVPLFGDFITVKPAEHSKSWCWY